LRNVAVRRRAPPDHMKTATAPLYSHLQYLRRHDLPRNRNRRPWSSNDGPAVVVY
jgi:hypothetical protein